MKSTRKYTQKNRAAAEKANTEAVLNAALEAFSTRAFDEVTLKQIADESGLTVQTVIRKFGSKEELFEQLAAREEARILRERNVEEASDLDAALEALLKHYERDGDMVINFINQEQRFEQVRKVVERGRQVHREWVETHCTSLLDGLNGKAREESLFAAIAATDLGTWKLLRRDNGLSHDQVKSIMARLLQSLKYSE